MKKIIAYSFNLLFLVTFLASCLGDLDTMPLDNNQLVSDQVYKTKDGYTGVLDAMENAAEKEKKD